MEEDSGEIYKITNKINGKMYIGQTVSFLKKKDGSFQKHGTNGRWKQHIYTRKYKTNCRLLAESINQYGSNNFNVETLLICNKNKLNYYETLFIQVFNTIHPYGFNLNSGGKGLSRHHDETKELISNSNKGKIRTKEMRKEMSEIKMVYTGLPEYIYALNDPNRNISGYRVRQHPTLPEKKFSSKNLTMEQKLQQAIDYVNGISSSIKPPSLKKSEEWIQRYKDSRNKKKDLPKYIYETHDNNKNAHGYIVRNHPTLKKKQFVSQKLSMEEKLEFALQYLTIDDNNEVHRPNGDGSPSEA